MMGISLMVICNYVKNSDSTNVRSSLVQKNCNTPQRHVACPFSTTGHLSLQAIGFQEDLSNTYLKIVEILSLLVYLPDSFKYKFWGYPQCPSCSLPIPLGGLCLSQLYGPDCSWHLHCLNLYIITYNCELPVITLQQCLMHHVCGNIISWRSHIKGKTRWVNFFKQHTWGNLLMQYLHHLNSELCSKNLFRWF